MSNSVEKNYQRINVVLSIVIAGLLATVGGIWLFQNKDSKNWGFKSPVRWAVDQALKSDPGIERFGIGTKFEAKKIEIDTNNLWKGTVLSEEQAKEIQRKFGGGSTSTSQVPAYQPPARTSFSPSRHR